MGELLIQQGRLFHQVLTEHLKHNEERTTEMRSFAVSIVGLLGGFAGEIGNACRKFFKRLKVDESEDESIIFLSKFVIDILNQLAKKVSAVNRKIQADVVQPLTLFLEAQRRSHADFLRSSQTLLYSLQSNNDLLRELGRNFTANETSLSKTLSEKELLKEIVELEMQKCNAKWQEIKRSYQAALQEADSLNSTRCSFTLRAQITTVRLLNRLVNSTALDDSLNDYEQLATENETLSLALKDQMRDRLGRLLIFEEIGEDSIYELVGPIEDEREKLLIDDFVGFFTSRYGLREDQRKFQEARSLILQQMRWMQYFLGRLKRCLYTETKLNNSKFRQLATIIKYIFAMVVEVDSNEAILYDLLSIAARVRHKDQYLIRQLGKHEQFWRDTALWQGIIQVIRSRGRRGENYQPHRLRIRNLFSRSTWVRNKMFDEKRLRNEKVIQDSRAYEILCEANYYMAKLQLEETFIFDFMLQQASRHGVSRENTRKLLEYHYMNKMVATNKTSSNYLIRKARLEEKAKNLKDPQQRLLICVSKSLRFLPLDATFVQLLLVSKRWSTYLREKLLKRLLIYQRNQHLVSRMRLRLYLVVCNPPFSRVVYDRMVQEVPQVTEHSEIINLDARRSLGWEEKLRVQMVQVLKVFSYYHPDNGYLQGMNYLCENILKLTDDTYTCYSIFENLMNNQYYNLYTGNFDGLKIKIYQFMRILQRERPQLYDHLRAEKLQGQHFLLSWAITLWGEMSGDLCWVLWDGFVLRGWEWWFKTTLWLLRVLEPELLKMNFQEIMKCFSDLHSTLLSYSQQELADYGIDHRTVKSEIAQIRIQKEVLSEIEKEYKLRANMINDYLKTVSVKKK